jgi:Cd2+/Zn2+-exporting ATPase
MNALMSVSITGAVLIGAWEEGAMVVLLFSIAEMIEEYTASKANRSVVAMLELTPETALIKTSGGERETPVSEIRPGDVAIVRPGDRIPVDGVVAAGNTTVDQSAVTGESAPVAKTPGDMVFAGTINVDGAVEIEATKPSGDTMIARIRKMVEEARQRKAPAQTLIDRFARVYTPAAVAAAAVVAVAPVALFGEPFEKWFYRALVMLVIACPCALVISTPVAIVAALGAAARGGVLVRGGAHLEAIGRARAFAFDKTGTLTRGKLRVSAIAPMGGHSAAEALAAAAALNRRSEHHIASAILENARASGLTPPEAEDFRAVRGRGVSGLIGGVRFFAGNLAFMSENSVSSAALERAIVELESGGATVIAVASASEALGLIAIEDEPRAEAAEALREIRRAGAREIVMLTGDNFSAARRVADAVGVDSFGAGLLPDEKLDAVRRLKERRGVVAMVGDGVNDAPALAEATVGIAMGAAGSDAAVETADIALVSDDISRIPFLMRLGAGTISVIKQNIAFAIALKASFLVAAAFGAATLWMAVFADTGASIIVVLNSVRLARAGAADRRRTARPT